MKNCSEPDEHSYACWDADFSAICAVIVAECNYPCRITSLPFFRIEVITEWNYQYQPSQPVHVVLAHRASDSLHDRGTSRSVHRFCSPAGQTVYVSRLSAT